MKTRRLKSDGGHWNVVWFGSYGVNSDGTAKFYNIDNIHDNYSEGVESVSDSLNQWLSIIREELWYDINYGLPLLEKYSSKIAIDSAIAEIIYSHPNVSQISSFTSEQINHHYSAKIVVETDFDEINLQI